MRVFPSTAKAECEADAEAGNQVFSIQLSCHYYSLKGSMLAANQTRSQSLGSIPGTQLWDMSVFICRLNIHPENISNPHITCFSNTHFSMNFLETPHSILVKAT